MAKSSGAMRRSGGTSSVTEQQDNTLSKVAKRTRDLKNEQYRIIDENGDIVLEKRGGRGEVASSVGEKREYMQGAVSIHNHPDGGTFSDADLKDFGYGARAIVVASPEGTYRLTNMKYGQRDSHGGWLEMQRAMQDSGVTRDRTFREIRSEAESQPHIKRQSDAMSKTAAAWAAARDAGKPQAVLDKISEKYEKQRTKYKADLKAAERKVAVQPYHDFYRQNASKYGFKYEFTKR